MESYRRKRFTFFTSDLIKYYVTNLVYQLAGFTLYMYKYIYTVVMYRTIIYTVFFDCEYSVLFCAKVFVDNIKSKT